LLVVISRASLIQMAMKYLMVNPNRSLPSVTP
jgi:hypothetical protein